MSTRDERDAEDRSVSGSEGGTGPEVPGTYTSESPVEPPGSFTGEAVVEEPGSYEDSDVEELED